MRIRRFNRRVTIVTLIYLNALEQPLSLKQRQEIEFRLSNYSIPLQILQMVAENCGCNVISEETRLKGSGRNAKNSHILAALDDKSILLLQQIFLECHDSFSNFRLAVFLSCRWSSVQHKFVMGGEVAGKSGQKYVFDVCTFNRETGELVALGMQNNDAGRRASDNKALLQFLSAIGDLHAAHPNLHSAYYASSYGYKDRNPTGVIKKGQARGDFGSMDIKLLEYKNTAYFENKAR